MKYSYNAEKSKDRSPALSRLCNDSELRKLLHEVDSIISVGENQPGKYVWSHPKQEHLVNALKNHFEVFKQQNEETRAIVFCQFRSVVVEVYQVLQILAPELKPVMFIGQGGKEKGEGLQQKKQLEVMRMFRSGEYSVLIATCVAEEGLDIGDVDLIVLMEAHRSPVRLVQRMGRTGRQRNGRCVVLLTKGSEEKKFFDGMSVHKNYGKVVNSPQVTAALQKLNVRMIPKGLQPERQLLHINVETSKTSGKNKKGKRKQSDIRNAFGNSPRTSKHKRNEQLLISDQDPTDNTHFMPQNDHVIIIEEEKPKSLFTTVGDSTAASSSNKITKKKIGERKLKRQKTSNIRDMIAKVNAKRSEFSKGKVNYSSDADYEESNVLSCNSPEKNYINENISNRNNKKVIKINAGSDENCNACDNDIIVIDDDIDNKKSDIYHLIDGILKECENVFYDCENEIACAFNDRRNEEKIKISDHLTNCTVPLPDKNYNECDFFMSACDITAVSVLKDVTSCAIKSFSNRHFSDNRNHLSDYIFDKKLTTPDNKFNEDKTCLSTCMFNISQNCVNYSNDNWSQRYDVSKRVVTTEIKGAVVNNNTIRISSKINETSDPDEKNLEVNNIEFDFVGLDDLFKSFHHDYCNSNATCVKTGDTAAQKELELKGSSEKFTMLQGVDINSEHDAVILSQKGDSPILTGCKTDHHNLSNSPEMDFVGIADLIEANDNKSNFKTKHNNVIDSEVDKNLIKIFEHKSNCEISNNTQISPNTKSFKMDGEKNTNLDKNFCQNGPSFVLQIPESKDPCNNNQNETVDTLKHDLDEFEPNLSPVLSCKPQIGNFENSSLLEGYDNFDMSPVLSSKYITTGVSQVKCSTPVSKKNKNTFQSHFHDGNDIYEKKIEQIALTYDNKNTTNNNSRKEKKYPNDINSDDSCNYNDSWNLDEVFKEPFFVSSTVNDSAGINPKTLSYYLTGDSLYTVTQLVDKAEKLVDNVNLQLNNNNSDNNKHVVVQYNNNCTKNKDLKKKENSIDTVLDDDKFNKKFKSKTKQVEVKSKYMLWDSSDDDMFNNVLATTDVNCDTKQNSHNSDVITVKNAFSEIVNNDDNNSNKKNLKASGKKLICRKLHIDDVKENIKDINVVDPPLNGNGSSVLKWDTTNQTDSMKNLNENDFVKQSDVDAGDGNHLFYNVLPSSSSSNKNENLSKNSKICCNSEDYWKKNVVVVSSVEKKSANIDQLDEKYLTGNKKKHEFNDNLENVYNSSSDFSPLFTVGENSSRKKVNENKAFKKSDLAVPSDSNGLIDKKGNILLSSIEVTSHVNGSRWPTSCNKLDKKIMNFSSVKGSNNSELGVHNSLLTANSINYSKSNDISINQLKSLTDKSVNRSGSTDKSVSSSVHCNNDKIDSNICSSVMTSKSNTVSIVISSDSSDSNSDIFKQNNKRRKRLKLMDSSMLSDRSKTENEKRNNGKRHNEFIENEAEVSGETTSGTEASGLNSLDNSFIDDLTQRPENSMYANYAEAVKNRERTAGGYKIPMLSESVLHKNVYSQAIPVEHESYNYDSFCVGTSETGSSEYEMSYLERAEKMLAKHMKRKKKMKNRKFTRKKRKRDKCSSSCGSETDFDVSSVIGNAANFNSSGGQEADKSSVAVVNKKKRRVMISSDSE